MWQCGDRAVCVVFTLDLTSSVSSQGAAHGLLPPKNYSEVCRSCRENYKNLSSLYGQMQKLNDLENKAEPGTHLCIDVEDAVSAFPLAAAQFSAVERALRAISLRYCVWCLRLEIIKSSYKIVRF